MKRSQVSTVKSVKELIPDLFGWRGPAAGLGNALALLVAVLLGEWVVHQLEYLIEYQQDFQAVMSTTPHRFYMTPAGMTLGLTTLGLLMIALILLIRTAVIRRQLLRHLPTRLRQRLGQSREPVASGAIALTATVMATGQILVYFVQENLESYAASGILPGAAVLFAPQHLTAVPLHLLFASCLAILLWAITSRLGSFRQALSIVRVLAAIFQETGEPLPRQSRPRLRVPSLRLEAGILCLRSPPLGS